MWLVRSETISHDVFTYTFLIIQFAKDVLCHVLTVVFVVHAFAFRKNICVGDVIKYMQN